MTGAWTDPSLPLEQRVRAFVEDLDAAELIAIALGDFTALSQRGLPTPRYVDAGSGLRDVPGATAFPTGIALAATFDAQLATEYGGAVGAETRTAGFSVLLGPTLDLARDPRAGRIPEALGEDPFLTGLLGAAHVRGAQANHIITQLKHFVAYNGEDRRTGYGLGDDRGDAIDVHASIAVLQDAYLRPFRSAVEAGAWSMMGSYNRVHSEYVCESDLLQLPRREWGWQGFYCPDFLFAVRDDAAALAAGLDLGALGGPGRRTPEMVDTAPAGVLDALVANLVRALIGSGLSDHPLPEPSMPSTPEHRDLAERTAIAAAVLLKNDAGLPLRPLPLGPEVGSIALIGPSGADAIYVLGGSAAVDLDTARTVTPAAGILARAGRVRVERAQGSLGDVLLPTVPAEAFTVPDGSGAGIEVEFADPSGRTWTEVVPQIDHVVDPAHPLAAWPRCWRTRLTSAAGGRHRLSLGLGGRATVRLGGEVVMVGSRELEQFIKGPFYPLQATVELAAGEPIDLQIDYEPGPAIAIPPMHLGPTIRLGWQQPDALLDEAAATAARCDAAVVLVNQASGEGMDRDSLALPGDQDELVRRVAAVNPRTVVVLNTPGAVLLPWLDDVAAVLQVWYPGERFGSALAAVLFGDAEPGGRLPVTFPHAREHLPGGDHGPERVPTELNYDADGGIGYRAPGVREHGAAFPFGHGLGYSAIACELQDAALVDDRLRLRIGVNNEGTRSGVHVAQLYAEVAGAAPELVGVVHVPVAAGASASATVEVGSEAFARWDGARSGPVEGVHRLQLGTSSAALSHSVETVIKDGRFAAVLR